MSMFQHEAKQFKFDILREVSKRCYEGTLNDNTPDELAHLLVSSNTDRFRCCIYKERAILKFIEDQVKENGYPPSVREIGKAIGLSSTATVHAYLAKKYEYLENESSNAEKVYLSKDGLIAVFYTIEYGQVSYYSNVAESRSLSSINELNRHAVKLK